MIRSALVLVLIAAVSACTLAPPQRPQPAVYDFGPGPDAGRSAHALRATLTLDEVGAPPWLASPAIVYRLAYDDIARPRAYAQSRWAAPPAALVAHRLRAAIAQSGSVVLATDGARAPLVLRVELDQFSHVIETPQASHGLVRLRASLVDGNARALLAQRVFEAKRPAPSVDAEGAVRALTLGTDDLVTALLEWAAAHPAVK